jgi:hypothetical protein
VWQKEYQGYKNANKSYEHVGLAGGEKHPGVGDGLGHDVPPDPVHLQHH